MRRLFLPLLILAVVIAASVLADRANRAADAGEPDTTVATDSLGTPIINVRRIPEWLRRPTSNQEFEEALKRVLNQPEVPAARCLRVHRNGIEIAVEQPDLELVPAELQRLVTVAAVESLGTETVFVTKVVSNEASLVNEGVLEGDIWLVGGGDPVLSTNDYLTRFDDDRASTSLDQLAAELAIELRRRGISEISGGVVGDEFRFSPSETDYVGTVWTETDNADNVVGPLSGLLVNDGFQWDRQTRTVTRSEDPATLAAGILTDLLIQRGITITAEPSTGEQPASAEQVLLATIESPPIEEIAQRALIDGTTAEMLFKEVGRVNGVSPASNDAAFGMLITLLQQGLPVEGSLPLDGSGLSSKVRVTCDLLMAIIEQSPAGGIVSSSLKGIRTSSLAACAPSRASNMRVISADRGHITALAGVMTADNGAVITFVLLANADTNERGEESLGPCNSIQTSLLEAVARYPNEYGPTPDSIATLAVIPAPRHTGLSVRELAMFPLEQAVLPSAIVPLHIFEERYRALARLVVALDEPEFGITMIERGREVGGDDLRSNVGVVARVIQAEEFPDGRWGIIAIATRRIRVERWSQDDPYPKTLVTDWPDSDTDIAPEALDQLFSRLKRILTAAQLLAPNHQIDEPALNSDDPTFRAWQLVVAAQLGALDNQRLLREPGWHQRAVLAVELFEERADVLEALVELR